MLHCELDHHVAITNLPTRPQKMMEGEVFEIFVPMFKYLKPKVARTATSDHHLANATCYFHLAIRPKRCILAINTLLA